jgi:hypothetical protein
VINTKQVKKKPTHGNVVNHCWRTTSWWIRCNPLAEIGIGRACLARLTFAGRIRVGRAWLAGRIT